MCVPYSQELSSDSDEFCLWLHVWGNQALCYFSKGGIHFYFLCNITLEIDLCTVTICKWAKEYYMLCFMFCWAISKSVRILLFKQMMPFLSANAAYAAIFVKEQWHE